MLIYADKPGYSKVLVVVLLIPLALVVALAIIIYEVIARIILITILIAIAALPWSLTPRRFEVWEDSIRIKLGFTTYIIPLENVEDIEVIRDATWRAGGWGLRFNPFSKEIHFVTTSRGVRILMRGWKWREVVITPRDPEKFALIVKDRVSRCWYRERA
jgi:hypothetical protein